MRLYSKLKNKCVKIPSGEITNLQLIEFAAKKFEKIDYFYRECQIILKSKEQFKTAIKHGTIRENITLLQCTTDYPASFREANLNCNARI